MDTPRFRTAPVPHEGYPPGIPFIVGNEAAERFSFYGMKVLLTFYFTRVLQYTAGESADRVAWFTVAVYFTPLLGGMLADRFLGKYRTIMYLSVVCCLGHLVLSLTEGTRWGAVAGLGLIALGAGGIKPCVSAHVGDQFAKGEEKKLEKIFSLFYFMINFGAGFSQILMPMVNKKWGYSIAFAVPGVLMGFATILFWMGRYRFIHVPPSGPNPNSFWRVVWHALTNPTPRKPGEDWLDAARDRFDEKTIIGVRAAIGVIGIFSLVTFFWMLQDQLATTWTIQAAEMDLQVFAPGSFGLSDGWKVEAEQVQSINAFLVLVLIPLMTYGVYPWVSRLGFEMTSLRRMSCGMLCTFTSFIMAGVIQMLLDRGHAVSVLWQVPGYVIITLAEVMVSITGLEFAYTQAPKSMKSTLMSFWLISIAAGNFLFPLFRQGTNWIGGKLAAAGISGFEVQDDKITATNFFVFAATMLVAGIAFTWNASRYKPVNFMEPAAHDGDGDSVE